MSAAIIQFPRQPRLPCSEPGDFIAEMAERIERLRRESHGPATREELEELVAQHYRTMHD